MPNKCGYGAIVKYYIVLYREILYRNSIYFNEKATMKSLNNNHVLSQSSMQLQRAVQCKPAFVQEHLP